MSQYIFRRFLQMIPIAFGILTLVFSLIHMIPGDPAVQIAGEGARPEDVVAVRKALGLDQPLWTQYVHYVTHVIRGDFGTSFQTNLSVADQIKQRQTVVVIASTKNGGRAAGIARFYTSAAAKQKYDALKETLAKIPLHHTETTRQ